MQHILKNAGKVFESREFFTNSNALRLSPNRVKSDQIGAVMPLGG